MKVKRLASVLLAAVLGGALALLAAAACQSASPLRASDRLELASDLPVWIDDYVHAYGGTVAINGVQMNSAQLLAAVRANSGAALGLERGRARLDL